MARSFAKCRLFSDLHDVNDLTDRSDTLVAEDVAQTTNFSGFPWLW